ncbi:aspartyl/asparaginyl beta-hydroxylase domain-containing protein [Henriciella aquimarina]|uniref:aspartyl/asparaginyl beta-hydroxylase domain-containing protein n=1 Tax=Henriciella aquimarina TaxID=545261 RepID=UPI0009FFF954|nr:aspartyl/asparaginyl beta-hydroxylase domain-containing protein [Henriciella aquimarina]
MEERLTEARSQAAAGMQALQTRNGPAAQTALTRAIELGWPGPDVWVALSFAKSLLGDMDGRIAALEKALDVDPTSVRARLHHGQALSGAGRKEEAAAAFRMGLSSLSTVETWTTEMDQLVSAARAFLGLEAEAGTAPAHHPVDDFARDYNVGADPDDDLFRQSLDMLAGRIRPYVSKPTRYLYPGLPNRQFYPLHHFAWTEALAAKTPEIHAELENLLARQRSEATRFSPYVEKAGREGTNVSHPLLDNPDWSAFYLIKQGERQEENIALCPKTMAAIDALGDEACPAPAQSVLFSLLKPGASIPPHHGQFNTRLICHLPVILPGQCGFRVGNETREWKDGEVFIFDDTIEHEAWNRSEQPRYVLIFEIWRPELSDRQRQLISSLFALGGAAEPR